MANDDTTARSGSEGPPRPLVAKLALWAMLAIVLVLVLWGTLHAGIPPVNPAQAAPEGHWRGACANCHIVTDKAPLSEGS